MHIIETEFNSSNLEILLFENLTSGELSYIILCPIDDVINIMYFL